MAYKIIDKKYCVYNDAVRYTFVADVPGDISSLPVCCAGSTCICTENHSEYMVGANGKWHKIKTYTFEADPPSVTGAPTVTLHFCTYNDWQIYNPDGRDVKYSIDGGATWNALTSEYLTVNTNQIQFDIMNGWAFIGECGNWGDDTIAGNITITEDTTIHCYVSY